MAAIRVKKRTFSGAVCEQQVFSISSRVKDKKAAEPVPPRKMTEEEKIKHRDGISQRKFVRMINANFGPTSIYSTLTFGRECEVHTFWEARRVRDNYYRRLLRASPDAKIVIVMGRGKHTSRIHFHMISEGVAYETIKDKWLDGDVIDRDYLREHNWYRDKEGNWTDHGRDYTALAVYLHSHWTAEQGGHRWKATRNMAEPDVEDTKEIKRTYSPEKPPRAPKGYIYVGCSSTEYSCTTYIYVLDPGPDPKRKRKRKLRNAGICVF